MKRTLIDLGADYAVDFTRPYYGGASTGNPSQRARSRRRCTIVDKRGNGRLVVQHLKWVCVNAAEFETTNDLAKAMMGGKLRYEQQYVLVEISDSQVVARWGEQHEAQVRDGRPVTPLQPTDEALAMDGAA